MQVSQVRSPQAMPWRVERSRTRARMRWIRAVIILVIVLVMLAVAAALVRAWSQRYEYTKVAPITFIAPLDPVESDKAADRRLSRLRSDGERLATALRRKIPNRVYIVIDQTNNRIYLKKQEEIFLTAVCSAGGGVILQEMAEGGRRWVFDTPQGVFKVLRKDENPVWKKPDWAFLEEGRPIPSNDSDRFEYGSLGEYALQLGNGYMIHGTLYERLLGRSVTHGCIRVGRDDLRVVWKECPVGTPVYIF